MLVNNLKEKKTPSPVCSQKEQFPSSKYFPSPIREWTNSIYVYNTNTLKSIPYAENLAFKIIKTYFSMYNKKIENILKTKKTLKRLKKYSSNKIYISNGEFKHTNNKVLVNLYLYNRQKYNYILFMNNWQYNYMKKRFNRMFITRLKVLFKELTISLQSNNKNKDLLEKLLNTNINAYMNWFYRTALSKSIKRIKAYFYYKQLLYVNKNITNYNFLHYLQIYIENIYNKNVEFNLINLKRFFLNSDILSFSITMKIARNRRKLLKYLNVIKNKIKIHKKKVYVRKSFEDFNPNIKWRTDLNDLILKKLVFKNIKYKHVSGFRIESRGRLTRRHTASRSISKIKYKGNLLDIDSSHKGLSTLMLRGNLKSNLQFTKLKSKTRIGSFGIKGWISGN